MTGLGGSTGNSAEDQMSNAAGCIVVAVLVIAVGFIVSAVLLVRALLQ